ncbi:type I-E CRISPR-associated protein Cas5/CasD [Dermatophilus congolensis]|uniref:CRISPR-associated protein Cas5/CasD, subtype I-E/ECOLI n=1 Tax=Dermatophilus congolensis TaxID=1863 RepID=A0A239VI36_9MICO|nr:type I-E CRISPR-associated protein Cas5/CasD [Dermatophilus congolensis]MBO3129038.1 type I-E CRISPR-associated protein Cas5/CasD [Dermatophilus congolensis]MBO3132325.1 type I-E CRISPR-associated protein Cas5/CasD [Dermatophilus congolensis]MBO3133514.1 type I-E CRISPR-associated protein Cas5/CasD [Dermatophilus congolensis]MBO3135748.1 type I-E CRISPR-associated protein Cas5/CasD [Dermatophilus congolensis]MBO3137987.1 type I-E CRISPR-associated protein Cas5/CasD [Dermatophilus congolensi
MAVLLLRLAGPLQSWGDSSRFTQRLTRSEPTKSGVVGLLAAAQGRRRSDPIEDLAHLLFGVRVDQPGRIVRDFHTAIRWQEPKRTSMPLSYRYYLADAVFVAGVSGDQNLLEGLNDALKNPSFPLYLGRRSCPLSGQVSLGVHDAELEEALRQVPWQASAWHRRRQGKEIDLPLYLDVGATTVTGDTVTEVVRDVPESFSPIRREYGWREVVRVQPQRVHNPAGHDRDMDFMAVLGGA